MPLAREFKNKKRVKKHEHICVPGLLVDVRTHRFCEPGKAILSPEEAAQSFHFCPEPAPLNWQVPELNKLVWCWLASYARKPLKVLVSGDKELEELRKQKDFRGVETSIDPRTISISEFLKNWEGVTRLIAPLYATKLKKTLQSPEIHGKLI